MSRSGAAWLFRVLLRAYPAGFRRRFGDGMTVAFLRDLAGRGSTGTRAALWMITVFHVFTGAPLEHLVEWRRRVAGVTSGRMVSGLGADMAHAIRLVRRTPLVTVAVTATLGIGIAGTTVALEHEERDDLARRHRAAGQFR
jgi:hypothetical protein